MVCAAQVTLDGDAAFCVDIDSKAQLVAVGLISGRVKIYDYMQWQPVQRCNAKPHKEACRALSFSDDGSMLYTAGSDSQLQQRDVATNKAVWKQLGAHESAINTLSLLDTNGVGTADDDGAIKLWDLRDHSVAMAFKEHTDYVSQMLFVPSRGPAIAATSGDGHLSVYDLRRGRLDALSDDMEDELLCAALVKGGKKLLCGMGEGVVGIFSWGNFGDINDRLIGHTEAVEAMVAYNDDMVFTGCSDGLIRAVGVQPNAVLGVVGEHDEPVEALVLDERCEVLCSCSHDGTVRLWDVRDLQSMGQAKQDDDADDSDEDSENDDDGSGEEGHRRQETAKVRAAPVKKLKTVPRKNAAIKMSSDFFSDM